jgi:hypothetical protein
MEALLQDLRFGLRTLVRRPAFTLVAVVKLALGIGANTALFTVVEAVLLRGLPFRDPDRLAVVWCSNPDLARAAGLPDKLPVAPGMFFGLAARPSGHAGGSDGGVAGGVDTEGIAKAAAL